MHLTKNTHLLAVKPCRPIPLATRSAAPVQSALTSLKSKTSFNNQEAKPIKTCHTSTASGTHGYLVWQSVAAGLRQPAARITFFLALALLLSITLHVPQVKAESTPTAPLEGAQAKGLAVAKAADQSDAGFGDSTADMAMVLQISENKTVTRMMRQLTLEVADDGDKSILVFDRPRDLKGTAILTHTHRTTPDDQWLYLPALKRVKRISSSDKSGPFMGSEFAYEDLASQEVEKYHYRYLREEPCADDMCDVIERIPTDKKSGYSYQIAWFDQSEHRLQRVDYFDRKRSPLKTMEMVGYRPYLDQFWRPDEMHMSNHQTGKSTILQFSNHRFQVGLNDADFTRNAVSRMR